MSLVLTLNIVMFFLSLYRQKRILFIGIDGAHNVVIPIAVATSKLKREMISLVSVVYQLRCFCLSYTHTHKYIEPHHVVSCSNILECYYCLFQCRYIQLIIPILCVCARLLFSQSVDDSERLKMRIEIKCCIHERKKNTHDTLRRRDIVATIRPRIFLHNAQRTNFSKTIRCIHKCWHCIQDDTENGNKADTQSKINYHLLIINSDKIFPINSNIQAFFMKMLNFNLPIVFCYLSKWFYFLFSFYLFVIH